MQSVKTKQGMAIYTAECSHTFHFPCIASHVKKQDNLVCPVCNSTWKDVPLLAIIGPDYHWILATLLLCMLPSYLTYGNKQSNLFS